jgi:hypothetical protein
MTEKPTIGHAIHAIDGAIDSTQPTIDLRVVEWRRTDTGLVTRAGRRPRRQPALKGCSQESAPINPATIHYQSMSAEPHVKPEPNAAQATFMPRSSLPLRTASAIKIGIVAAVVLP